MSKNTRCQSSLLSRCPVICNEKSAPFVSKCLIRIATCCRSAHLKLGKSKAIRQLAALILLLYPISLIVIYPQTSKVGQSASPEIGLQSPMTSKEVNKKDQIRLQSSTTPSFDEVSACLLVMDDNHFLVEWLAYHWTTLPLRRLIVAIDPLSNGSPLRILRRWESLMNISIWEDDHYFNRFLRSSILRSVDVNGTSKILINMHRQRQKVFYFQCMRKLKDEGHHWTAFVDTDELIFLNKIFKNKVALQRKRTASGLLQALRELKQLSSPCVGVPRLLFGPKEYDKGASEENDRGSYFPEIGFSPTDFMTTRWRWHAGYNNKLNGAGKALLDVSRVSNGMLLLENVNAHRPIRQLCTNEAMWIRISESPLVIFHYVGTYEQWILRDDVRSKRTSMLYSEMAAVNHTEDVDTHLWLLDFIQALGEQSAAELLADVGKVRKGRRMSPEEKVAKLLSLLYGKKTRKLHSR